MNFFIFVRCLNTENFYWMSSFLFPSENFYWMSSFLFRSENFYWMSSFLFPSWQAYWEVKKSENCLAAWEANWKSQIPGKKNLEKIKYNVECYYYYHHYHQHSFDIHYNHNFSSSISSLPQTSTASSSFITLLAFPSLASTLLSSLLHPHHQQHCHHQDYNHY